MKQFSNVHQESYFMVRLLKRKVLIGSLWQAVCLRNRSTVQIIGLPCSCREICVQGWCGGMVAKEVRCSLCFCAALEVPGLSCLLLSLLLNFQDKVKRRRRRREGKSKEQLALELLESRADCARSSQCVWSSLASKITESGWGHSPVGCMACAQLALN